MAGLRNRATRSSTYVAASGPAAGQGRRDLGAEAAYERLAPLGRQHVGDGRAACGDPEVGHGRVRPVEQPQLHQLVGRDVRDDERPVELPRRPRRDEGVLRAPTAGRARRRRPSRRARRARRPRRRGPRAVVAGTIRSTIVSGKPTEVPSQSRTARRSRPRRRRDEAPHDAGQGRAVGGGVVAGDDVDRGAAGPEPRRERRAQPSDDRDEVRARRRPSRRGRRRPRAPRCPARRRCAGSSPSR